MIADVNFHDLEENNPHAHVMLTTRSISEVGFGNKNRDWDKRELIEQIRVAWSDHANAALAAAGFDARIDHRSFEEQGITDQLPTIHLGPTVAAMRAKGIETDRGNLLDAIVAHNQMTTQATELNAVALEIASLEKEIEEEQAEQTEINPQVEGAGIDSTASVPVIAVANFEQLPTTQQSEELTLKQQAAEDKRRYWIGQIEYQLDRPLTDEQRDIAILAKLYLPEPPYSQQEGFEMVVRSPITQRIKQEKGEGAAWYYIQQTDKKAQKTVEQLKDLSKQGNDR